MKNNFFSFTKTISWKITKTFALIFSIILIIFSASLLYGIKYYLIYAASDQVKSTSVAIERDLFDNHTPGKTPASRQLLDSIPPHENIYVRILNSRQDLIISSSNQINYNLPIKKPFAKVKYEELKERHLVYITRQIGTNPNNLVYLQVAKNMHAEYRFIEILFVGLFGLDCLGIIISIFSGLLVSKRMLEPIDNITRTAQSISIKDLSRRIDIKGPDDELTRLGRTFNSMTERLQNSFEQQNQFVSDASHELRTPIAVIQGYVNMLDRWGKEDKQVLNESIRAIKAEADSMNQLIEKLLFLARGENGNYKLEKIDLALNELIEEVVMESRMIANEHVITNPRNDTLIINADPHLIKQVMRAVIDNSIKFTPIGGNIEISSIAADDAVITIKDSGIGMPDEDVAHIFNRFYRVDKARAKGQGGNGLGLSIAKMIVDAHGGSISAVSKLGRGTIITITLPRVVHCT